MSRDICLLFKAEVLIFSVVFEISVELFKRTQRLSKISPTRHLFIPLRAVSCKQSDRCPAVLTLSNSTACTCMQGTAPALTHTQTC